MSAADDVEILLLGGPAGVGKSTVSWEMSAALRDAGVNHVLLDSDELDRVWPLGDEERRRLNEANLSAFWGNAAALGHRRLVLVGVFVRSDVDREWILAAIPNASIRQVILMASEPELERRVRAREVGSGAEEQLRRSLNQSRRFRSNEASTTLTVDTDGASVVEIARQLIAWMGWDEAGR